MSLINNILSKKEKLSIIGLGYVGLPIAIAFSKHIDVVGFDVSKEKIDLYNNGIDPTNEVGNDVVSKSKVLFTSDEGDLKECKFHIVAVPTPVNEDNAPDLTPVSSASNIIGRNLTRGSIVVYESTVYPGVTEEVCIPILERESGLKFGVDFQVGYSPERINPGDKVNTLETIVKVVSGSDEESLDIISKIYELVVKAGIYKAPSIKVAEASKVIENAQRDINIAFMNELSMIFHKMDIDTLEVLKAAGTKWNFLNFKPGLVGGHCIGVDPYYLTYRSEQFGYHSKIILSGRKVNDNMGKYIAEECIKLLIKNNVNVNTAKVGILGLTFKEDCPDVRNSKVVDIINELKEYNIKPLISDPIADKNDSLKSYGIELDSIEKFVELDCLIIAVSHKVFTGYSVKKLESFMNNKCNIIMDLKGTKENKDFSSKVKYWRL